MILYTSMIKLTTCYYHSKDYIMPTNA